MNLFEWEKSIPKQNELIIKSHPISGVIYEGKISGDKADGWGIKIWPEGGSYVGEWIDGKANG